MNEISDAVEEVHRWERKAIAALLGLLTTAFMVWGGVVWNGTDKVVSRIDQVAAQMAADRLNQAQYQTVIERRLTIQEQQLTILQQRQAWVIEQMHSEGKNGVP